MEFGNIEGLEVGIILQSRREMKYFAYHKEIFNEKNSNTQKQSVTVG